MSDEQLVIRLRALANTLVFNADTFKMAREAMFQAAQRVADYADAKVSHEKLVSHMDRLINDAGAARQASLCDLVDDVARLAMGRRNDSELLQRVVRSMAINVYAERKYSTRFGAPLWSVISNFFALGSTRASELCCRFGFDPDSYVKRTPQ